MPGISSEDENLISLGGIRSKDAVLAAINKAGAQSSFIDGMMFHSDRGTQYASKAIRNTFKSYSLVQAMSRAGNC